MKQWILLQNTFVFISIAYSGLNITFLQQRQACLYLHKIVILMRNTPFFILILSTFLFACKPNKNEVKNIITAETTIPAKAATIDTIKFMSNDGLEMTAVAYTVDTGSPVIVLCHQARMNDYEYAEIAPKLNALGYNCLALNQRSGGAFEGHENQTTLNAEEAGKPTTFKSAIPDIEAGVNKAFEMWRQPIILWGSSYSATLCLKVAMENDKVRTVVVFSPIPEFDDNTSAAEYFKTYRDKPIFVTSNEKEAKALEIAFSALPHNVLTQYIPDTKGTHGSKALWSSDPASEGYWNAVTKWLQLHDH